MAAGARVATAVVLCVFFAVCYLYIDADDFSPSYAISRLAWQPLGGALGGEGTCDVDMCGLKENVFGRDGVLSIFSQKTARAAHDAPRRALFSVCARVRTSARKQQHPAVQLAWRKESYLLRRCRGTHSIRKTFAH